MYRPQDEHDRVLELEAKLRNFRNTNITPRNNGVSISTTAFGTGSKTSAISDMNGPWAITPLDHNIGSFNSAGNFVINTPDGGGRYHIQLLSTSVTVMSNTIASPLVLSYIDGIHKNGQWIVLRSQQGKSTILKAATATDQSTGNLKLDADITLDDHHIIILQFFSDIGTGGGKYVVVSATSSSGGGFANVTLSNLANPTAINQNLIFGDGTTFAQGKDLINIDTLDFHSTTAFHPYIVGNGSNNQFNIGAHGSDIITLTNAFNSGTGVPDNGILQVFGMSHGTHAGVLWIPSLKTVNLSSVISSGDTIGGLYYDALNSALTQKTFASIFAKSDVITSGAERGSLRFNILIGTTLTEEMFIDQGGINMNSVAILASGLEIDGGNILLNDGVNIFAGTSTGTKIGFSTSEKLGFWGKTPVVRQTVTGSRGGNAALQSLLSALNTAGVITDSTTP